MSIMFDEALVFEHKLRERCNAIAKELEELICEQEGRSYATITVIYSNADGGEWQVETYSTKHRITANAAELSVAVEQFKQKYYMQRSASKLRTLIAGPSNEDDEVPF